MFIDGLLECAANERDPFELPKPVDFYFDETSDKAAIRDGWEGYVGQLGDDRRAYLGAEPRFEDDEVFLPLQAADFIAWWMNKWSKEFGIDHLEKGRFPFQTSAKIINYNVMRTNPDMLFEYLRTQFYGNLMEHGLSMRLPSGEVENIYFDWESPSLVVKWR